jgi:hypothetical protein
MLMLLRELARLPLVLDLEEAGVADELELLLLLWEEWW